MLGILTGHHIQRHFTGTLLVRKNCFPFTDAVTKQSSERSVSRPQSANPVSTKINDNKNAQQTEKETPGVNQSTNLFVAEASRQNFEDTVKKALQALCVKQEVPELKPEIPELSPSEPESTGFSPGSPPGEPNRSPADDPKTRQPEELDDEDDDGDVIVVSVVLPSDKSSGSRELQQRHEDEHQAQRADYSGLEERGKISRKYPTNIFYVM